MKIGYPGVQSLFFSASELRLPDKDGSEVRISPKSFFKAEVEIHEDSRLKALLIIDNLIRDLEELELKLK